ncbi:MAG TPA: O-antigen ligase family protein [Gaiellaceae bacterium]|nr:O-antigen ligase family protein [Gaiellaceae bacterium]
MSIAVSSRRAAGALALLGLGVLVTLLLTLALWAKEPSAKLAVAAGVGLVTVTALAMWSENAAVFLGATLLAIVRVEPAPTDAVFLIVIAIAAASGRLSPLRAPAPIVVFLGSYLTLNVLAATQAVSFRHALRFSFTTFYLAALGLWLAGWLTSRGRVRVIVRGYLVACAFSALLGVAALYGPFPGRSTFVYANTRAVALFKDPNVLGSFLAFGALILAEELLRPSLLRSGRRTQWALFLLVVLGVVFSYSRAAWGALAVGLLAIAVVYGLRRGEGGRALALLGSMVFAGIVALAALSATGQLAFLQQRAHVQGYDAQRFGAQSFAIQLAERHPLGVGPGQFESYSAVSVHETYLRALSELGVLGLVLVAALLLTTLAYAVRNAVRGIDTYGLGSATLLGAWVGLVGSGFVIDTLHWRHLWVAAALIWAGAARAP